MKNEKLPIIRPERGQEYYNALADKLDALQASKNDGRGVDCVKALIMYLRKGMIRAAKSTCFSESDKFTFLDDIQSIINNELYEPEEEKPWSFFEK